MDIEIHKSFSIQVPIELSGDDRWVKATMMDTWLVDNVGQYNHAWKVVYLPCIINYYFQNAEDAVWFALTWT
jgi:hypothetical protein